MKLIFESGEKLYDAQNKINNYTDLIEKTYGINLYQYQKNIINKMINDNKSKHSIYGDDFRIDIIENNINGNFVLSIQDYDENQKIEETINIIFSNDELDQLINLLKIVRNKRQ